LDIDKPKRGKYKKRSWLPQPCRFDFVCQLPLSETVRRLKAANERETGWFANRYGLLVRTSISDSQMIVCDMDLRSINHHVCLKAQLIEHTPTQTRIIGAAEVPRSTSIFFGLVTIISGLLFAANIVGLLMTYPLTLMLILLMLCNPIGLPMLIMFLMMWGIVLDQRHKLLNRLISIIHHPPYGGKTLLVHLKQAE
jgi:hypothetical protein